MTSNTQKIKQRSHLQDAVEEEAGQAHTPDADNACEQQALGGLQQGQAVGVAVHGVCGPHTTYER